MKTFGRLTLFGAFAAAGVGLAVCVGSSSVSPEALPKRGDSKLAVRVVTEEMPGPDGLQRPVLTDPERFRGAAVAAANDAMGSAADNSAHGTAQAGRLRHEPGEEPAPLPGGPIVVEPYPLRAQQAESEADRAKLQEAYDYLRRQLGAASGAGALPSTMPALPPGVMPPLSGALAPAASAGPAAPSSAPAVPAAPPAGPSAEFKPSAPPARPRAIVDTEGDGKLSIRIQNADIREVLDLLSEQGNMNILAGNAVQGKVSATLSGVDLDSALDAILKSTGFVSRRDGKFIFVGTPEEFNTLEQALDRVGTRVYRPNYIAASDLQKLIQPMVTEKVGVVSVSTPAQAGIQTDGNTAGGNTFSGGDVVVVRDYEAVLCQIDQMVAEVDVRPLQVHIEAMILSVKLKDGEKFGVNFQLLRDKNINIGLGDLSMANPATLANLSYEKGALKLGFLDSSLGTFLEALETLGDVSVIATPRLMVLNKQRAEIQIGEKKGYVSTTVTETSSTQAVEFLDIGTLLRLRPYVSNDGLIRMELHPELSDGTVDTQSGFTLPNKQITQVTTNIMVRDGCTVIIGGLMRENLATTTNQLPLLGNLPVVGFLFRSKQETTERQEVIVLVTPHIVYEPGTCREGEKAAAEFHRRQSTYADKMSPLGKRSLGRRYYRLAQSAYAAGDRNTALRFAEMAVQFDPLNRAAIDLRSDIWLGKPAGDHTLGGPVAAAPPEPAGGPLEAPGITDWMLDDLEHSPVMRAGPGHPLDPGQPGRRIDVSRPRRLE